MLKAGGKEISLPDHSGGRTGSQGTEARSCTAVRTELGQVLPAARPACPPAEIRLWPRFFVTDGEQGFWLHLLQISVASGGETLLILRVFLL